MFWKSFVSSGKVLVMFLVGFGKVLMWFGKMWVRLSNVLVGFGLVRF